MQNYGINDNPVKTFGRFQTKQDKVIKDEEKIRYITLEEFNQFISVIHDDLWKVFFYTLYYTGMRKSEIQALTWNDIDFNKSQIIVNKIVSVKTTEHYKITSTKNNLNRKIKMSKTLNDILFEYKKSKQAYNDFSNNWFVFGDIRFLPQTTIDRKKHQFFLESGVNEITIHEFRHSHISLLINEYLKTGQTDTTKFFIMMANRMGHTIDVMQKTYMHLFPTVQDEIVDLLDNL
jgi:integrase